MIYPINNPSRGTEIVLRIPYSPRCAVAFGTEGVVIEGEGLLVFTEVYVGLRELVVIRKRGCIGGEMSGRCVFILLF